MKTVDIEIKDVSNMFETKDFDAFRLFNNGSNRKNGVNVNHINKIKDSIRKNGNNTYNDPLIIGKDNYIIDGQHRFSACKELNEPFWYIKNEDLTIDDVISYNALNRNWKMEDYMEHHKIYSGNPNYKDFEEFLINYKMTIGMGLKIYASSKSGGTKNTNNDGKLVNNGRKDNRTDSELFKDGDLQKKKDVKKIERDGNTFLSFRTFVNSPNNLLFVGVVRFLTSKFNDKELKRFAIKLGQFKETGLKEWKGTQFPIDTKGTRDTESIIFEFQKFLNRGLSDDSKVRVDLIRPYEEYTSNSNFKKKN